jgi:pilus assembly protein FimV
VLALYRLNAEVFEGDIHRLRAGTVLQVPTLDQMTAIPAQRAREELQTLSHSVLPMPRRSRDELRLSQGGRGGSTATQGSGGSGTAANPAEQAVAINAAMSEVQTRIKQLESIVASLNSLIAAREQQVAKVQAEIAAMGVPVSDTSLDRPAAPAEAPADPAPSSDQASDSGLSLGAANASLMRATVREETALQTALSAEENSVPTWVKILAGVAAASLLLAVVLPFFYMRRRRGAAEDDAAEDDDDTLL